MFTAPLLTSYLLVGCDALSPIFAAVTLVMAFPRGLVNGSARFLADLMCVMLSQPIFTKSLKK